jgi:hypothetical protein
MLPFLDSFSHHCRVPATAASTIPSAIVPGGDVGESTGAVFP